MIVKIKNDDKRPTLNFVYCEGDTIIPSFVKDSLVNLQKIYNKDTLYLVAVNDSTKESEFLHLSIYEKNKIIRWVVTNRRTYLMNNDGKTIEKLN